MGHQAVAKEVQFDINGFKNKQVEHGQPAAYQFQALKQNIRTQFDSVFADSGVKTHQEGLEVIESLSYQFMTNAFFVDMGWNPRLGELVSLNQFMRDHNLKTEYKLLILTIMRRFQGAGILKDVDHGNFEWQVIKEAPSKDAIGRAIKTLQTKLLEFPECEQEGIFANYIGPHLYASISGRENGLNILFPTENTPNFEYGAKRFYEKSMTMKYYKLIPSIEGVTSQIQFLLNATPHSETNPIRILEIGGGTGGTTIPLLRTIVKQNFPLHYTFTDISNFFVGKAKGIISEEFPSISMEYRMLDIEKRPEEQGIEVGSYDIVIAADVFHATEYLGDTLRHTRACLKTGGLLVLGEVFQSSMLLEISFGLAGGWWRWGDECRLHGSALLSPTEWDNILKETGFQESFAVGHPNYGVVFARA